MGVRVVEHETEVAWGAPSKLTRPVFSCELCYVGVLERTGEKPPPNGLELSS